MKTLNKRPACLFRRLPDRYPCQWPRETRTWPPPSARSPPGAWRSPAAPGCLVAADRRRRREQAREKTSWKPPKKGKRVYIAEQAHNIDMNIGGISGGSPRSQEVAALVLGVGLDSLEHEVGHELLAEVLDVHLGRPAILGLLGDGVVVLSLLPDIGAVADGRKGER